MGGEMLAPAWLAAANDPAIAARLESIYQLIADQIEARGPACWASGRCCNFQKTGHRLYVTGLEAAYAFARLPRSQALTEAGLAAAEARGDCPFVISNLCGIHAIKPIGCRVYFCDRSAEDWQRALSENALTQIKSLHDEFRIEYRYGEWRAMLRQFLGEY